MVARPPSPWYVPKPTGTGPLPPSPYAQHFPHSLSPPGWGGGQSLPPISAEEFITGTAGPCWGGQATRKINLFLPSLQSRDPSLPQLAGRDSPLSGRAGGRGVLCMGAALQTQMLPTAAFPDFYSKGKLRGGRGHFLCSAPCRRPPQLCPGGVRGHHSVLARLNFEAAPPMGMGVLPPDPVTHPCPALLPAWGDSFLQGWGRGRRTRLPPVC